MSAVDRATDKLRALIADGAMGSGDRLPAERELASRLGISRPALREAIRRLVAGRLIEVRRGSGTYVADVDRRDVFAVRLRLEPLAARLAAERASGAARRYLPQLLADLRGAVEEPSRFAALDRELHEFVTAEAANPVLTDALERLADLAALTRAVSVSSATTRAVALQHLTALVEAIGHSDAEAAEAAMARHLDAVRTAST